MSLKEVLQGFGHVAPNLGKILAFIPGAQVPGAILSILGEVFGHTDEDALSSVIQSDPAAAIKLRQIDSDERLATLSNQLQQNQAAYAAQQQTQGFFLQIFTALMKGFGPVKYFLMAFIGWYLLLFSLAFIASLFTNVMITDDEFKMLHLLIAPMSGLFSLLTVLVPLLLKNK